MRIELTRVGLLVYLANHYTTRGARSLERSPCCITGKVWDCGFQVSEFVLQSYNYIHFKKNILEKSIDPPYILS